jgi:prepilin-type processing-associated H-X9-DG protein
MTQQERPILEHDVQRDVGRLRGCSGRIVVLILGIVAGTALALGVVLLFQMSRGVERSMRVKCAANLRIIGQAITVYRNDHGVWPQSLAEIAMGDNLNPEVFICLSSGAEKAPGATPQETARSLINPKHCSYIYFPPPPDAGDVNPDRILAVERMANHNGKGMNILFADGHAEWLDAQEAQAVLDALKAGHNPPLRPTTRPGL